jgi:hypothetical protein
MSRPSRLEFPDALYRITSRGDGLEDIYRADGDRRLFFAVLADVCERFNWWAQGLTVRSCNHAFRIALRMIDCKTCPHFLNLTPPAPVKRDARHQQGEQP